MTETTSQSRAVEALPADDLVRVTALPDTASSRADNPMAVLSAVSTAASATPAAIDAIAAAARSSSGLRVTFPPEVMQGLRDGTLKLMQSTKGGHLSTAVDATTNQVAAHGRVVGDVAGTGSKVAVGASIATASVVMLPIAVAALASYQQQKQLEAALADIQATLNRIEERMKDEEHGVCDAADAFIRVASAASSAGPLPQYLRSELAAHRARVEAVYAARRRYVRRFKNELERQQIAREAKKGEPQPWVDEVQDLAKDGTLQEELVLFVRALIAQSQLDAFAAACLADEGLPDVAARLLDESEHELRHEFFDLHNRLSPLARIEPPRGLKERIPLMGRNLERAHETARTLVEQLNLQVLPNIPEPDRTRALVIDLSPDDVRDVAALIQAR